MLKIFAFILILPLSSMADSLCSTVTCDPIYKIQANHPQLQELKIELEDGDVITLKEFLKSIAINTTDSEMIGFSGEVPWPGTQPGAPKKEKDDKK